MKDGKSDSSHNHVREEAILLLTRDLMAIGIVKVNITRSHLKASTA